MEEINIGINIKRIRRWFGMTIPVFAKEVGLSVNTILAYEKGRQYPNLQTLIKLSNISGFTLDELVFTKVSGGIKPKITQFH